DRSRVNASPLVSAVQARGRLWTPPPRGRRRGSVNSAPSALRLADKFRPARGCGLDCREEARYEGPEIGESVGSRLEHDDGNRERDNILLKGKVSIHCYEYVELRCGRG